VAAPLDFPRLDSANQRFRASDAGAHKADIEEERGIARSLHLIRPGEENGNIPANPEE
jgi:hypothetical protein